MELFDHPAVLVAAIFLARVVDVSLGTVRTILVFRGHPYRAAAIGFVEILIWLVAASQAIQNLDTWYLAVAYAAGFACGNVVGTWLERKLAIGSELVRAISTNPDADLAGSLKDAGYDLYELVGRRRGEPVDVVLVVAKRRRIPHLLRLIDAIDPDAFYTTSDVKEKAIQHRLVTTDDPLPVPQKRK